VKVMFVNYVAPTQERSVDLQMALPCLVAVPDAAESPRKVIVASTCLLWD
jgi:hypothetical protein